jgi:hypothetical protein
MRQIYNFIIFLLFLCVPIHGSSQGLEFVHPLGIKCNGQMYWKLKTLNDAEGKQISNTASPDETTISALRKIKRPAATRPQTRWALEKRTVVIRCSIDTSGFEEDGDIHIVIRDTRTKQTMVAEIPNPNCTNVKSSKFFSLIKKTFNDYTTLSKTNTKFGGRYEITGVPFFDKKHNGVGAAPTMIEIHPVLKIKKIR